MARGAGARAHDARVVEMGTAAMGSPSGRRRPGRPRCRSAARGLLHGLEADGLEVGRHARLEARGPRGLLGEDAPHDLVAGRALEGLRQREHLVQRDAQRVDVALRADVAAPAVGLLGRHVEGRAGEVAGARELEAVLDLGQAEVAEARQGVLVEQDVGGLDVEVRAASCACCRPSSHARTPQPRGGSSLGRLAALRSSLASVTRRGPTRRYAMKKSPPRAPRVHRTSAG
jgi:hypothetical protein